MFLQEDDQWDVLYVFAKNLADNHVSFDDIEKELLQKTDNAQLIEEIIKQIKELRYAISRKRGLIKLGFAGMFLFMGFFITCINFHSNQSFTNVMFGFTTIGLLLMFWGLYEIIG